MESTTASVAPRAYAGGWRRLLGFAIVLGGLAVLSPVAPAQKA